MKNPKGISVSVTNNFRLNLLNLAIFLALAFTGSVIQIEYHMHRWPDYYSAMGLNKSGWLLLHKASAVVFLAGIAVHCKLNWRFISVSTGRILGRKLAQSSLSYWLFMLCIPTCLTAMISWLLSGRDDRARLLLVESHDKLGWLLAILSVIHIISRATRMTAAYRKLNRARGN